MDVEFFVLVLDGTLPIFEDAKYVDIAFLKSDIAAPITKKYQNKHDKLRWGLKPVFIHALLLDYCDTVIYTDNDICFFSSPSFLFEKLLFSDVLLSPHYCNFNSSKNHIWFEANFWIGLYNAGFIGVSKKGMAAMIWWAQCCLYNISVQPWRGLYDDQKYLDLMPVVFDNIEILRHKGCNVAGWNIDSCVRTLHNNTVVIEPDFPIVFIHFTGLFFFNIRRKKDTLLINHFNEYTALLKQYKPGFNLKSQYKRKFRDYLLFIRYCFWKVIRFTE